MLRRLFESFGRSEAEDLRNLYTSEPYASTDLYPEVPLPDPSLSPIILLARWTSHDLYGEQMPQIAADLLEVGFDTPSTRRLAGEILISDSAAVEPLVGRMFRELGFQYPLDEYQAEILTARQIAREVIAGLRNAWAAASHIEFSLSAWIPNNARIAGIDQLYAIAAVHDETKWDAVERRPLKILTEELLKLFAQLATVDLGVS